MARHRACGRNIASVSIAPNFLDTGKYMADSAPSDARPWAVFLIFLRLGLTSLGGPVAHLGYFPAEFVDRKSVVLGRSVSYVSIAGVAVSLKNTIHTELDV